MVDECNNNLTIATKTEFNISLWYYCKYRSKSIWFECRLSPCIWWHLSLSSFFVTLNSRYISIRMANSMSKHNSIYALVDLVTVVYFLFSEYIVYVYRRGQHSEALIIQRCQSNFQRFLLPQCCKYNVIDWLRVIRKLSTNAIN